MQPLTANLPSQLLPTQDLRAAQKLGAQQPPANVQEAQKVKETFAQFFGETFYGQLLKSMRSTVGEPAYFHGGRAEEVFRGQLDQTLSQEMTAATADRLGEPMFANAFPQAAKILRQYEQEQTPQPGLDDLTQLRRR